MRPARPPASLLIDRLLRTVRCPAISTCTNTSGNGTRLIWPSSAASIVDARWHRCGLTQPSWNSCGGAAEHRGHALEQDVQPLVDYWKTCCEIYAVRTGLKSPTTGLFPRDPRRPILELRRRWQMGCSTLERCEDAFAASTNRRDIPKVTPSSKMVGDFASPGENGLLKCRQFTRPSLPRAPAAGTTPSLDFPPASPVISKPSRQTAGGFPETFAAILKASRLDGRPSDLSASISRSWPWTVEEHGRPIARHDDQRCLYPRSRRLLGPLEPTRRSILEPTYFYA